MTDRSYQRARLHVKTGKLSLHEARAYLRLGRCAEAQEALYRGRFQLWAAMQFATGRAIEPSF